MNLASHLESLWKQCHASILITEHTYRRLRGTYRIREVDREVVKGKTETVGIYEIFDYHDEKTFPPVMEVVNHFKHGLFLYRKGSWN